MPDVHLERARALRVGMTDAELRLWHRLRRKQNDGVRFRRQVPIGPWIADFVCFRARLVVELDGGQHATDRGAARDAARDRWFADNDFAVLRFWNDDVLGNLDGVLQTIVSETDRRLGAPAPSPGHPPRRRVAPPAPPVEGGARTETPSRRGRAENRNPLPSRVGVGAKRPGRGG
ncbi:MAG: endonuclease domain-containing protein [Alphaproteobacteria bacterium]|nr:endonuclease domain-containing protein [Alphaproteobacteria bacterium]